jgi:hypothetical protein
VTQTTPEEIRTAAQAFNAEYPEAAEEIAAGTPELHVSRQSCKGGLRVVATLGVRLVDGGFAAAEDPQILGDGLRCFDVKRTLYRLIRGHYGQLEVPVTVRVHI